MQAQQVLQQVVCFSLEEISLWGARKKLRQEDLKLAKTDTLPPKDLASLGSRKIFNPKALAKFEALKKRAHVACGRVGIRFMGGYAVPETAADALAKELDAIGVEFDKVKADFIANYQAELDTWITTHPGWEQWIRAATIPVGEVKDRISYGWTPAKISPPDEQNPDSRLNQKMTKEAGGLAGRLFKEIGEMAQKVMKDSLLGKTRVNRRALSPIRKVRGKLHGLLFLDKRVGPLITAIDETLAQMPGDAPIEGLALTALHGLILTLSDIERMKQYGQALLDGNPNPLSLGVTMPVATAPVATTETTVVQTAEPVVETPAPLVMGVEQTNLFADEPNAVVAPVVSTVAGASNQDADAAEVEKEVVAEAEAQTPKVDATPADVVPMVRVVEVVKDKGSALPGMLPLPPKQAPFRRITF